MIRKLTLAIVTCPTNSILIQNHSAFHEYFANKRQINASLSLEIVKKTSRDRMQRPKKFCPPKKVCDRMLPRSNFPVARIHYSEIWPDFRGFWLPFPFSLFMYCYTKSQSNWKLKSIIPEFLPATNRWQRAGETLGSRLGSSPSRYFEGREDHGDEVVCNFNPKLLYSTLPSLVVTICTVPFYVLHPSFVFLVDLAPRCRLPGSLFHVPDPFHSIIHSRCCNIRLY